MNEKNELIDNMKKIHTTIMGLERLKRNLKSVLAEEEPCEFCKRLILDSDCKIKRQGKNFYCRKNNIIVTINSYSYTIITAHIYKNL